jgi:hypothetical protein
MSRKRKPEPLGYEPGLISAVDQMQEMVSVLNKTRVGVALATAPGARRVQRLRFSEMQTELRRLVAAWTASGPDLVKMFSKDPELQRRANDGKMRFWPTPTGRGHLEWIPAPSDATASPHDLAFYHFMTLIANPQWELLGGPCHRCREYYLKNTKRQKVYCSRTCGATETAIVAVRTGRQREHAKKISLAQEQIGKWRKANLRLKRKRAGWKKWVADETKLTVKWLTRAVNKGELRAPAGISTSNIQA